MVSLAIKKINWISISNFSILVSKVDTDSRERFLFGENNNEVAIVTPYPIDFDAAIQQGRRWPSKMDKDRRGHAATISSLISFRTSEQSAVIAVHVLPSIYELDPRDMLYFHMPLAYIEHQ